MKPTLSAFITTMGTLMTAFVTTLPCHNIECPSPKEMIITSAKVILLITLSTTIAWRITKNNQIIVIPAAIVIIILFVLMCRIILLIGAFLSPYLGIHELIIALCIAPLIGAVSFPCPKN